MSVYVQRDVERPTIEISATKRRAFWQRVWKARWCYLYMAPGLILAAMFTFYPIAASWYFSFFQWNGFSTDMHFLGLENYAEVFQDPFFWSAFRRSFLFVAGAVPIQLGLSLLFAILLNDLSYRLAPLIRTFLFVPVVTTAAIVGIVMTFVLSPFNGPINSILLNLNLVQRPVDFLGKPEIALWTIAGVFVWKWLGNPMIYWLAALQTIPIVLYEAAKVDGAGWWAQLRHITVPLLLPFAVVITLIVTVGTLHVFALVQTMTMGGPFFATEVMEVYIFRTAFGSTTSNTVPRMGYASAAAVLFGVSIMLIAIAQGAAARRLRIVRENLSSGVQDV